MKKEVIVRLHASFEELVQTDPEGGEYWLARDLQSPMDYTKWENFEGVIRRADQLIRNGSANGRLKGCTRRVALGSRAVREVIDYQLDRQAVELMGLLTTSFKLNGYFLTRNESVMLGLLAKWARSKGYAVESQFRLAKYKFDLMLADLILIEFDEPHHGSKRQLKMDEAKEVVARQSGFNVVRLDLAADVVDAILLIEPLIESSRAAAGQQTELAIARAKVAAKAKDFANEITNFNIKKSGLQTEPTITVEHVKNNRDVRDLLIQRGIQPEDLPPAEDIEKIERRVQSETKKLPAKKKR